MGTDYSVNNLPGTDALKRIMFALKLFLILRKEKPDILHVNLYRDTDWLDIKIAKLCKVKIIVHVRNLLSQSNIDYSKIKNTDIIIATSKFVKKQILSVNTSLNVKAIYNPIDIKFPKDKTFSESFLSEVTKDFRTSIIISSVGILDPRKGHDTAIRAIAYLRSLNIDATLLICGGDLEKSKKEINRLKGIVDEHSLSESVKFLGHVSDIGKIYLNSRFVLALSKDGEAFGRVPLEAAMYRAVVIGTRKAATPEIIKHGETGFLVEPECPDEVAQVISKYLNKNEDQLKHIGDNAYSRLESKFSTQRHCEQMQLVYERM